MRWCYPSNIPVRLICDIESLKDVKINYFKILLKTFFCPTMLLFLTKSRYHLQKGCPSGRSAPPSTPLAYDSNKSIKITTIVHIAIS